MTARIVLLPGDGVGPEVMAEARNVLSAVARRLGHALEFDTGLIGGVAIEQTGNPLPPETLELCRRADAVLLGAVGGPRWDDPQAPVRPEDGLLRIRRELGLFANLRPVRVLPPLAAATPLRADLVAGVDLLVVRELTGGIYFGRRGCEDTPDGQRAFDTMEYSTHEIERIVRLAAGLARRRGGRLASVDKANVLASSRLWRATAARVISQDFPDVQLEHVLVDAAAMYLIRNPSRFDVIVTGNMFGDILTDEASVLAGSMGLSPSASLGAGRPGLFEPIHGSAPDIAGRGSANPVGMILSAAMMCRESLGWEQAARLIEAAVESTIAQGARTVDIAAPGQATLTTSEMGARIAAASATLPLDADIKDQPQCVPT
jgi:3-isopropylmalate dehydrogenase